jgi:hypothetical protein
LLKNCNNNSGKAALRLILVVSQFASLLQLLLRKTVPVGDELVPELRARVFEFRDLFVQTFDREMVGKSRFIHSLLHLVDNVEDLGPMWATMEDFMETSHLCGKWVPLLLTVYKSILIV